MNVAYCTGFWCTNIGNSFFSMGVEHVLKTVLGEKNVAVVSDRQTYTTCYGKRLYIDKNQLEYVSALDVDYIVLAGPVISKYFLSLWKEILLKLKQRGIGFIILSAGSMKLNEPAREEIKKFFKICPPYVFSSRDQAAFEEFGSYAVHAYNGICFSFYIPNCYTPASMERMSPFVVYNFDKINEPEIWIDKGEKKKSSQNFEFDGDIYRIAYPKCLTALLAKTDRFTDALIYALSILPVKKQGDMVGKYHIIRTDHRFYPHFRRKVYQQKNSFVADLPYGYLNLYANAEFTLSDRIHACAVTLAFGHSAMLFAKTDRYGLLDRVGADDICNRLVKLDMARLEEEKKNQIDWLRMTLS
jgi:hypothetical protein